MATFDAASTYVARGLSADRLAAINRHLVGSVLDVGCGSGAYVATLADRGIAIGIDMHRFPTWGADRYVIGDATRLPLRNDSFDTLLTFETLEHLSSPMDALAECRRVTRKMLLLTVPNCDITPAMKASNIIYHHWIDPTHVNFWTLDEISDLVERSGFAVVERSLINRIDPVPFLREMLRLPLRSERLARWIDTRWSKGYRMTSLIVAEKS